MTRMGSPAGAGDACEEPLGGINRLIQDSRPRIKDAPARPWVRLPGGSSRPVPAALTAGAPRPDGAQPRRGTRTPTAWSSDPPGNLTHGRGLRDRLRRAAGGAQQREPEHAATLAERAAVEPEHAGRAQLVAARRRETVRQQRPLTQLERLAVQPLGPRRRKLGDQAGHRVGEDARYGHLSPAG